MRFLFALPLLLAVSAPALAQTAAPGATVEEFETALVAIEGRLAKVARGSALPLGRRDPAVAAQFATIRRTMALYGTSAFPIDFPNSMDRVCGRLHQAIGPFIQGPNLKEYQDEMTVLMVASTGCMAQHLPLFAQMIADLPAERRSGALNSKTDLREGVDLILVNMVALTTDPTLNVANQRALAAAAGDWGKLLGGVFPLDGRRALLRKIEATSPGFARTYPAEAARLRAGLRDADCNVICEAI